MNIFKKLFCSHDYHYFKEHHIEFGMGKIKYYYCPKCLKIKLVII